MADTDTGGHVTTMGGHVTTVPAVPTVPEPFIPRLTFSSTEDSYLVLEALMAYRQTMMDTRRTPAHIAHVSALIVEVDREYIRLWVEKHDRDNQPPF